MTVGDVALRFNPNVDLDLYLLGRLPLTLFIAQRRSRLSSHSVNPCYCVWTVCAAGIFHPRNSGSNYAGKLQKLQIRNVRFAKQQAGKARQKCVCKFKSKLSLCI